MKIINNWWLMKKPILDEVVFIYIIILCCPCYISAYNMDNTILLLLLL